MFILQAGAEYVEHTFRPTPRFEPTTTRAVDHKIVSGCDER